MTAIDFRAGLTLLPFLPMSPADLRLIPAGLIRGRLVQFDRSEPKKLKNFLAKHEEQFADLEPVIEELEVKEREYYASRPDLTYHHVRILGSRLRRSIRHGTVTAWQNLDRLDDEHAQKLKNKPVLFSLFWLLCLVPGLGRGLVKLWGHRQSRQHLKGCLTSFNYLLRAMTGARIAKLIEWHRQGRVGDRRAKKLVKQPLRYWTQRICLGLLPASWHRFLLEPDYALSRLKNTFGFVIKFLRVPAFREEFLMEEVRQGHREGMLTDQEADKIIGQIKDPYIQKYLRCLAVHICTLPVTQIVMVVAAAAVAAYCLLSKQLSWAESMGYGTATAVAIQLMPISPGSITRGVFVLYLMIKERDIRNYYIAAPVSFLHVIGYLAFPLQMVTHNPALARFLAGRWATRMAHVIPVFGERGGLLEHGVFDLFFNLPLSLKQGFKKRPASYLAKAVSGVTLITLLGFAFYLKMWSGQSFEAQLENVKVSSVEPVRIQLDFSGQSKAINFPASSWDATIKDKPLQTGEVVDAIVRKGPFTDELIGIKISRQAKPQDPQLTKKIPTSS